MTLTARRIAGPPPAAMRTDHLASLDEPQELYLERLVARGATWLLERDDQPAGYAVVGDGGMLLELFHKTAPAPEPSGLFTMLAAAAQVRGCLYQSFDPGMTRLAAAMPMQIEPSGILFRSILDPSHGVRTDASMRVAIQADIESIAAIDDGFFADREEIRRYLDIGGLSVLENPTRAVIGCGVAEPVLPGGRDIDIGMMVAPDFRRRGYGTFIASHLKSSLLSKGLRPICGCAADNIGSQRALRRAGFAADHRLLQFTL